MTEPLNKYWPQIIAVLGLTFGLGGAYFQIDSQADEITENKKSIETEEREVKEINEKLVRIETDQKNIKDDVAEMRDDIKEILLAVKE